MNTFARHISLPTPQFSHILQGLSLGFRNKSPYEESSYDTDNTIESVSKPVAEVITLSQVHIKHWHEGRTDDEVENPLEGNGNSHSSTTNGVGEYLGDENPADGTP